jgi:DNA-binding CsgD family transcriptional regulator
MALGFRRDHCTNRGHFMPPTTDSLILDKIDQILHILAVIATKDMKQREQIALLNRAGLQPKNIAELLGTSSNTVRVELVALRKSKDKKTPESTRGRRMRFKH